MAAVAYVLLQRAIIATDDAGAVLQKMIGRDIKGKASICVYSLAMMMSFWATWCAQMLYIGVALLWLVPDRRIEQSYRR